jgi:hypothetical protein
MIETLLGIESALLIAMARCRKRAAVLRSLAAKRPDSAGIRALTARGESEFLESSESSS